MNEFRKSIVAGMLFLCLMAAGLPNSHAGKSDDTLHWGLQAELETLDPNRSAKLITHAVIRNIHSHLLYRDPETMEIKPDLALSALVHKYGDVFFKQQVVDFVNPN